MKVLDRLWTVAEVADLLEIPRQQLRLALMRGKTDLPAFKLGREWRINPLHLCRWMECQSNEWGPAARAFMEQVTQASKAGTR